MRRRIYWLLPDRASARTTMDDLLLARIEQRHIHFVANSDADMSGLHEATVLQTSDLIRSAQIGLIAGGCVGTVAGLIAAIFPIVGEPPQWGLVAVLAVLGGAFGAWASSLIGISIPSKRLARFSEALGRGQWLLMVDVPNARLSEIEEMLRSRHPEGRFGGVETEIPAFP